ncbi:hypothetical protein [Kitasatospora sp. NBC_01266]|uniref:hypothetical protein n=1 Tax=Kitasatospora sp. NBC_01266 TaxID=2903572 RepID=UPI002E333036|nr:hypothetical protein [Kitasatospora sp. NBC_01266]
MRRKSARPERFIGSSFTDSVAFVLGTRPEIVKLAPAARHFPLAARDAYTGQHYDAAMSDVFFSECGLRRPSARRRRASLCSLSGTSDLFRP